jgi:hypothetical protein
LIPSGSPAGGHIVLDEHKKRLGRGGKLDFAVDYVKLPDGSNLQVRASAEREGKDKTGAVIVGTVLVSPLFLLMHGKDISVPKGTAFTAYVDGDHEIALQTPQHGLQAKAESTQPVPDPPAASDPAPFPATQASGQENGSSSADPCTMVVKSNPDSADISVDGSYAGSTPSTLRVQPGRHAISIDKSGFKTWQRNINVTADETITVDAKLDNER